ncbi:MAG TPA: type II secretion system F family protein, partial [Candidatus Sericytochromatia bacterium]
MPTFVARVQDVKGNAKKEKIVANTISDARTALRERGLFIQDLKQDEGLSLNLDMKKFQASMAKVTVKDKAV